MKKTPENTKMIALVERRQGGGSVSTDLAGASQELEYLLDKILSWRKDG